MAKLLILCNYFLAQTPGSLTTQLCIQYCSNHAGIERKDVRDGRQRGADDKAPRQQVKQPQPCPISQLHAHTEESLSSALDSQLQHPTGWELDANKQRALLAYMCTHR